MAFRRQRSWLDFACRDPRLEPKHFRVAYAIWSRSSTGGRVQLNFARISAAAGVSQAEAAGSMRRLAAIGYLHVEEMPAGGQQGALLALPVDLPARRLPAAPSKPVAAQLSAPPIGENCLPVLRIIADLSAGEEVERFIPWRKIARAMATEPARAGESVKDRLRRLDAARKRLSRLKAACLDAGAIEVDQARGVRLTERGAAAIIEP
jgi:Mn-dependent DtxR family transcriptional regulator